MALHLQITTKYVTMTPIIGSVRLLISFSLSFDGLEVSVQAENIFWMQPATQLSEWVAMVT